jgi:hypothetical protein
MMDNESLKGADALVARLAALGQYVPLGLGEAIYEEGLIVKAQSEDGTPVRHGILQGSTDITQPRVTEDGAVEVKITVGGPTAKSPEGAGYAVFVHEDTAAHHEVGHAKYLEIPINAAQATFGERVAARLDLKKGLG